jgi:hypothetical protein
VAATGYARRIVCGGFCEGDELAVTPNFAEGGRYWERIRPKVNAILSDRMKIVSSLLTKHKSALRAVASDLVQCGTLFQEDVEAALRRKRSTIAKRKGGHGNE